MAIKLCIVRESKDRLSSTCRCNFGTSLYWGFLKYLWCVIEPWVTILFYCNIICVEQCVPDIGHSSCLCNLDFFISKTPSWICEKCVGSACTQNQIVDIEDVEKRAARFVRRCYDRVPGSMTLLLYELQWPSREQRQKEAGLTMM